MLTCCYHNHSNCTNPRVPIGKPTGWGNRWKLLLLLFGARGLYGLLGPIQIMRSWLRKCDEDCGKVAKMVKPAAAATKSKSQILGFVIGTLC